MLLLKNVCPLCIFSGLRKDPVIELPPLPDIQPTNDLTSLNVPSNQLATHPDPTSPFQQPLTCVSHVVWTRLVQQAT